jgi:hypothetical protein
MVDDAPDPPLASARELCARGFVAPGPGSWRTVGPLGRLVVWVASAQVSALGGVRLPLLGDALELADSAAGGRGFGDRTHKR